ncbi:MULTISPECIES: acyl carrier protein [Actinoplanes]|uniref:acyl carrier protein n=1 Tax=Actinoplanes TaxID=1865 RepID=UPI0005F2D4BC|nr:MULTISPECIES: acyl carrier protein [Actinoplanes]GLY04042.1 hypothetical protein Acsp01_44210 [Actinoplanes sp. NBRC 101535]
MSESRLTQVLQAAGEVFGGPVTADDNFFDLGGDSVAAVEFATLLEDARGDEVDPELVMAARSLAALARSLP